MFTPNEEQSHAIYSDHPDILCVAGAGSGKTATLIARILDVIVRKKVKPEQIIVITYTNAAADEIIHRLGRNDLHYVGTVHGYMLKLIQWFAPVLGFRASPVSVLDEKTYDQVLKEVIASNGYRGTISALQDAIANGGEHKDAKVRLTALDYHRRMLRESFVDFDSILTLGLKLLKMRRFGNRDVKVVHFPTYLFWDEFQDSGPMDAAIRDALDIPNKFTVGDPDQAIFGFRGAEVRHIVSLARRPAVEVLQLQTNFRCDRSICEAAQRLIEHNPNRIEKKTIPHSQRGGEVAVWNCANQAEELQKIFAEIVDREPSKCAILLRNRDVHAPASVDVYAEYFRARGISIAEKEVEKCPIQDWQKCKLFVQLLVNPENNTLAKRWIEATDMLLTANRVALEAVGKKSSINQHYLKLPRDIAVENLLPELVKRGFSQGAVKAVEMAIERSPGASMSDLSLNLRQVSFGAAEAKPGLTVTTIHSAKGREWDFVYLPGFEQAIIPAKKKGEELEAERRLAYVAFTRARHLLVISHCRERNRETAVPSQFLMEAGL